MKLNLWTFFFQLINFFVLLYILKRLLYKPIREIIEKRRALIQKTLDDAAKMKQEAQELRERHQQEVDRLRELTSTMMEKARQEAEQYKAELLGKAREEATGVLEKEKALFATEKKRIESELKARALEAVTVYASRLLKDLSDKDLHQALCSRFIKDISAVSPRLSNIKKEAGPMNIRLATAYPFDDAHLKEFKQRIEALVSGTVTIQTTIDKDLLAGIRINVSDMVYDASLSGQVEVLRSRLKEAA